MQAEEGKGKSLQKKNPPLYQIIIAIYLESLGYPPASSNVQLKIWRLINKCEYPNQHQIIEMIHQVLMQPSYETEKKNLLIELLGNRREFHILLKLLEYPSLANLYPIMMTNLMKIGLDIRKFEHRDLLIQVLANFLETHDSLEMLGATLDLLSMIGPIIANKSQQDRIIRLLARIISMPLRNQETISIIKKALYVIETMKSAAGEDQEIVQTLHRISHTDPSMQLRTTAKHAISTLGKRGFVYPRTLFRSDHTLRKLNQISGAGMKKHNTAYVAMVDRALHPLIKKKFDRQSLRQHLESHLTTVDPVKKSRKVETLLQHAFDEEQFLKAEAKKELDKISGFVSRKKHNPHYVQSVCKQVTSKDTYNRSALRRKLQTELHTANPAKKQAKIQALLALYDLLHEKGKYVSTP